MIDSLPRKCVSTRFERYSNWPSYSSTFYYLSASWTHGSRTSEKWKSKASQPSLAKSRPFDNPIGWSPRVCIIRAAVSCYGIYRSLHRYKAIRGPVVISSLILSLVLAMGPLFNHEPDSQPPYIRLIRTSTLAASSSFWSCGLFSCNSIRSRYLTLLLAARAWHVGD